MFVHITNRAIYNYDKNVMETQRAIFTNTELTVRGGITRTYKNTLVR